MRFNQDFATLEFYTGNNWATVNTFTEIQNSPGSRGRGVVSGGRDSDLQMQFINIASKGAGANGSAVTATNPPIHPFNI